MKTKKTSMLWRFSLYSFLRNQQYYDPFLILILRGKGLSFFMIGLLISVRQVGMNIMEIPSGLIAEIYGRRRAMIFSCITYILSFIIFAVSQPLWSLFLAMIFFAMGEAFRTGTHKAMIFDWLAINNQAHEKTRYYGFTRSWGHLGAALSVIIAVTALLLTENYAIIFWISVIPYSINILNFLAYPSYLDGGKMAKLPIRELFRHMFHVLTDVLHNKALRRIFIESMIHKGSYRVSKTYFQPLIKQTATALPFLLYWTEERRSTLLIGIIFFILYIFSSLSSRNAHRFSKHIGDDEKAYKRLWLLNFLLFASLLPALYLGWNWLAIILFVTMIMLQNIWRPILMNRIDTHSDTQLGATILSIDSQAASFVVMLMAPILGLLVDKWGFWTIAAFGAFTTLIMLRPSRSGDSSERIGENSV